MIFQQTVDLHIPDEITDVFDLLNSIVRKFYAGKFFLDQYQQLQLIEGIKVQIVSEVHLICNSFGINLDTWRCAPVFYWHQNPRAFPPIFPPRNTPRL